jgi:hypothetical protein
LTKQQLDEKSSTICDQSAMTLSIMTLSMITHRITQQLPSSYILMKIFIFLTKGQILPFYQSNGFSYSECDFSVCHYAKSFKRSVKMLCCAVLSVIILCVIILNVVAPITSSISKKINIQKDIKKTQLG